MLTPVFDLSQNDEYVVITIKAPYAKVVTVKILKCLFELILNTYHHKNVFKSFFARLLYMLTEK